jgi:hypothetical protein
VNKVTTYPTANNVFVYQVLEKVPDRPVEEDQKTQLAARKYSDWVTEKKESMDVSEFDLSNSDNVAYLIQRAWASA